MREYLYNVATDKSKGFVPGLIKLVFLVLSCFYGLTVRVLSAYYRIRPCRLDCKVISVGNITWGGTGKTVLVEFIAHYLSSQGHKVVVLTRGYNRSPGHQDRAQASPKGTRSPVTYETMGDEAYMLAKRLSGIPVIVDRDRVGAAKRALRDHGVDTVILDDGLQQWRIKKDLEIVVLDAINPFGNRKLLPRGILREPLSALRRAHLFILTKTDLATGTAKIRDLLCRINNEAPVFESIHSPVGLFSLNADNAVLPLEEFRGKTVALFSGIGDPGSFEDLFKANGIDIGLSFRFPDHHPYSQDELSNIIKDARLKGIAAVITTEKDAARMINRTPVFGNAPALYFLRIELKVLENEEGFRNRLAGVYTL